MKICKGPTPKIENVTHIRQRSFHSLLYRILSYVEHIPDIKKMQSICEIEFFFSKYKTLLYLRYTVLVAINQAQCKQVYDVDTAVTLCGLVPTEMLRPFRSRPENRGRFSP